MIELRAEILNQRAEKSYSFEAAKVSLVEEALLDDGYQNILYGCPYTQTVYFATADGFVPNGGYLRARRYSDQKAVESFSILSQQKWILEAKLDNGIKERCEMPFSIIMDILTKRETKHAISNSLLNIYSLVSQIDKAFPIVATEWKRDHFVKNINLRATVDTSLTYFAFAIGKFDAKIMAKEAQCKLEIKGSENAMNTNFISKLAITQVEKGSHEEKIREMYKRFTLGK